MDPEDDDYESRAVARGYDGGDDGDDDSRRMSRIHARCIPQKLDPAPTPFT